MIIIEADQTNLLQAAVIHSVSWQESHRAFCAPDFIEKHTPERQRDYLQNKINGGAKVYMLVDEKPLGVVSVTGSLIEDLYVLPEMRNRGRDLSHRAPCLQSVKPIISTFFWPFC